ncbi:MAG: hypothetical protein KDC98_22970, partial [Planctomycetes bacterium]|nr:hypothetical protein [Planctomycetota bacterium]
MDSSVDSAHRAGARHGSRHVRAVVFGALLALALSGLPALRLQATGIDRLGVEDWLGLLLPIAVGVGLGRIGRRSRPFLFVVAIAVAVVAATAALAVALMLARVGALGLLGAIGAAHGVGLGVLAPRSGQHGPWRWSIPAVGGLAAAAVIAISNHPAIVELRAGPALAMTLVLAPVLALFTAAALGSPPRSPMTSRWHAVTLVLALVVAIGLIRIGVSQAIRLDVPP